MQVGIQRDDRTWVAAPSSAVRFVMASAIVAAGLLSAFHAIHLGACLHAEFRLSALFGLVAGALAADLATGLVHWSCDTWGSERTHWFGPSLIRSFREHHRDPGAMLDHDWIEVNGEVATATGLAFLVLLAPPIQTALAAHPTVYAFVWAAISTAALANQLHQWSHMHAPPSLIRALQRHGLVLSRSRHARHHRSPYTTGYCISTGWLNGILDAVGFWRALERMVTFATGAEPRSDGAGCTPSRR